MPVEIDNVIHQVYVLKRPYVDEFLCRMGELFECVLFTASLAKVSFNVDIKVLARGPVPINSIYIYKSHFFLFSSYFSMLIL